MYLWCEEVIVGIKLTNNVYFELNQHYYINNGFLCSLMLMLPAFFTKNFHAFVQVRVLSFPFLS